MAKLYEALDQLKAIDDLLEQSTDPETQEILASAQEALQNETVETAENYLKYMDELKAKIAYLKDEADRITKKARAAQKRYDWIKQAMEYYLRSTGENKKEIGTFTISIRKNPPKVIIDDEQWLPDDFCNIVRTADKTKIKEAMTDGKLVLTVDGHEIQAAHLEQSESISIK